MPFFGCVRMCVSNKRMWYTCLCTRVRALSSQIDQGENKHAVTGVLIYELLHIEYEEKREKEGNVPLFIDINSAA